MPCKYTEYLFSSGEWCWRQTLRLASMTLPRMSQVVTPLTAGGDFSNILYLFVIYFNHTYEEPASALVKL